MTPTRHQRIAFAITALLFSTLACRAATRLIIPDTPTPQPTITATLPPPTFTLTPFLPPITPTVEYSASCPLVLDQIITDSTVSDEKLSRGEATVDEKVAYLVHYSVVDGELKTPLFDNVPANLEKAQQDRATHEAIWDLFKRLIPADQREIVSGFAIFTDGKYNYLAAVTQADRNPYKWELNVDFADATQKTSLTFTLLHEYGHLLTLNNDQVKVSVPIYHNPYSEDVYKQEVDACPQYFPGEGCSNPDSYINQFFQRFWTDFYAEWQVIDAEQDKDKQYALLDDFYKTYQDQFLTDYAPTSPAEDIAESWAFFILAPKPELDSIAHEKILFFYEYPELAALRAQILDRICAEYQQ
ncbi:MAG: hypothetical protein ABI904_02755 [Chloroflexota bacterium]